MTTVPDELDRRFRDAAASAGLLDVAYDYTDSPVGRLLVATSERGLCRISFDPEPERELDALARAFGARVLRSPRPVEGVRRELDEYFDGRAAREFDLTVDLTPLPNFQREVLEELVRVPYGHVDTYGGLAQKVGKPRAARAVGGALNRNPDPDRRPLPPHRRRERQPHRLRGRAGAQAGAARPRRRASFRR